MASTKQQIREKFRNAVFERDGYKCVFCTETENLDAHHITDRHEMVRGGYVKENGITLCMTHHFMAEKFHICKGLMWEGGFHPTELYKKINSSYQIAYEKSQELE